MLAIQLYIGDFDLPKATQSNESSEKNKPTTRKQTQKYHPIFVELFCFGDRCVTLGETDRQKSTLNTKFVKQAKRQSQSNSLGPSG